MIAPKPIHIKQSVLNAALNVKYLSSRQAIDQFIVKNVLGRKILILQDSNKEFIFFIYLYLYYIFLLPSSITFDKKGLK